MSTLREAIQANFRDVVAMRSTHQANEDLRQIMTEHGLGVAVLVAWQQGLRVATSVPA